MQLTLAISVAVPYPEIFTGTQVFTGFSGSAVDPNQGMDTFLSNPDGFFVGYGTGNWNDFSAPPDPNFYANWGQYTQATCSEEPDGSIVTMSQWWIQTGERMKKNEVKIACQYDTYVNGNPPFVTSKNVYMDTKIYKGSDVVAGILPGACPATNEEASAGIGWMEGIADRPVYMYNCTKNCGAFSCKSTPLKSSGVPVPYSTVGIWELHHTPDDELTEDWFQQYKDGTFVGYGTGTWNASNNGFAYFGAVTQSSCSQLHDGTQLLVLQSWHHDMKWMGHDVAKISCSYELVTDNPRRYSAEQFTSPTEYSVSQMFAGSFPGSCPLTLQEAQNGISWMGAPQAQPTNVYKCIENCGNYTCDTTSHEDPAKEYTCKQARKAYKSSKCCGNPNNVFHFPNEARRISAVSNPKDTADLDDSELPIHSLLKAALQHEKNVGGSAHAKQVAKSLNAIVAQYM